MNRNLELQKNQADWSSDERILIFSTRKTFSKILKYSAPYVLAGYLHR
jgi:hypothetical protein